MASMAADTFCSRCKSYSHLSKDCTSKPFIRVFCAHCNRPGHSMEACPKKAFEEREEKKKASEERELRLAEQSARAEQRASPDNMDARSDRSSTASTAATRADVAPQVCSFCGTARPEVKTKPGRKACKDRCQTCFRKF